MSSNAVQSTNDQSANGGTVMDLIRTNWKAISAVVPETITPKRFGNLLANSVRATPALASCTSVSLVGAMLSAASLGLEVDSPLGEANLVPYRRKLSDGKTITEAQLIIGYQGILKLYRQHPESGSVASGWVGSNDQFDFEYGTQPRLSHKPAMGDRGEPIYFWASYTLKDGTTDFVVLTPQEVADLRGKPAGKKGSVADPQHWMARKTALKQVLKMAPKSTQFATALRVDEVSGSDAAQNIKVSITTEPGEHVDTTTGEITAGVEHVGDQAS